MRVSHDDKLIMAGSVPDGVGVVVDVAVRALDVHTATARGVVRPRCFSSRLK